MSKFINPFPDYSSYRNYINKNTIITDTRHLFL